MRYAIDDSFLIGRERGKGDVGKAGSAVEATGEGQGRTAPQTFDRSKVSARGLSFGVPSSGSPVAASFSAAAAADACAYLPPVLELALRLRVGFSLIDRCEYRYGLVGRSLVDDGAFHFSFGAQAKYWLWLVCFARASRALG